MDKLSALALISSDHLLHIEPIRAVKVGGLVRKKHFYRLKCTSETGLRNIITSPYNRDYLGYSISFYQKNEALTGVRFQISLKNLPEPFKSYDVATWLEILVSQTHCLSTFDGGSRQEPNRSLS